MGTYFEVVSKYADAGLPLPKRGTKFSAGYDFVVAEDTLVMPYTLCANLLKLGTYQYEPDHEFTLEEVKTIVKQYGTNAKPTLVPTGMKCHLEPNQYLELSVRSSTPLKYWLILANGVGIIDAKRK